MPASAELRRPLLGKARCGHRRCGIQAHMSEWRSLQTSGVEFSYREFGSRDGLPVILLHGFPDAAEAWDDLVALLQPEKRKLRLFVLSMRGYGQTVVRQENLVCGDVAALASDVLVFANAVGIERFLIIGHDWGSRAGCAVSVLAPEKVIGLLLLSSPYVMFGGEDLPPVQAHQYWYQWYFQTAQGEKALREDARDLCEHIWHAWSPSWKFSKRTFEQAAAAWKNPQFAEIVLHSYQQRWGNALSKPAYAALQNKLDAKPKPKISVPTVFGYGTEDVCVLPEASEGQGSLFEGFYERLPIKGAGHFPHRENPKAVLKLIERLLKQVGKEKRV